MTIKTREFWTSIRYGENIDDEINDFVKENPDIEIVDIKYQTVASKEYIILTSALVMYKEVN